MVVAGLGQEEQEDFLPDFEEYMEERELNYSRLENSDNLPGFKAWVFWNRQDDDLTLSYDHSVDSIPDVCASPKIRLNIRHALHQLIWYPELNHCLVQFWAPKRTLEGRTLLTTQFQPFALGATCDGDWRNTLCEYRMGMCREYNNCFYADAESGEEQLGLPGRVFLNKLDERAPNVEHYTLKEYPQRDLALRCKICESWALPVFEQSSHTCVGVLEIAYIFDYVYWHDKEFLGRMYDIFQEFGLRCFDGYKHCKIQDGDENKALTTAIEELNKVYESVCKNHDLPLALTWVSCRSCNHLLQSQFQFSVLDYCDEEKWDDFNCNLLKFIKDIEVCHLRKGQVAGRILSFPDLLYCSDVKQFHIDEFPLVPFARYCELGGWFTMCLQSSCTGDELYVLEFFLPKSTENKENILTKLRLILGTMEKNFKTFKLASGQGLGEVLSVEVIDFLYGQRSHSTRFIRSLDSSDQQSMDPSNKGQNAVTAEQNILVVSSSKKGKRKIQDEEHKIAGVGIEVSLEEILKCSEMRREDAAKELNVSISTLKRVCRDFGVIRWPPHNKDPRSYRPLPVENLGQTPQLNYDLPSNQASASAAHIKPSFQDSDKVTIRATCEKNTIKFRLSLSSRLVEMQQEVAKRLNLEGGTYYIKYKDEEDVLILIACDEDLQDCLHTSRSRGISSIAVLLELIK